MAFRDGYLSEIVGRPAVLGEGAARRQIGKVIDFVVERPDDTFPKIDGMIVKTREGNVFTPLADVLEVESGGAMVLRSAPRLSAMAQEHALYLIRDLFDKQIVDVDGRKVVRINDLEVANTGGTLRVVAADIGVSGLLRRLGANKLA